MWNDSFKLFVRKLGKTFKQQKIFLKTEMNHDEVYASTRKNKQK